MGARLMSDSMGTWGRSAGLCGAHRLRQSGLRRRRALWLEPGPDSRNALAFLWRVGASKSTTRRFALFFRSLVAFQLAAKTFTHTNYKHSYRQPKRGAHLAFFSPWNSTGGHSRNLLFQERGLVNISLMLNLGFGAWGTEVIFFTNARGLTHFAVGQKQWYHYFGVGAPPILVYFSGDWDVHWGYGILTHGHFAVSLNFTGTAHFGCSACVKTTLRRALLVHFSRGERLETRLGFNDSCLTFPNM